MQAYNPSGSRTQTGGVAWRPRRFDPGGTAPAMAAPKRAGKMVELADILSPNRILLDVRANSKRQTLRKLAEAVAADSGLSSEEILAALLEREKLGTTGIGEGMAIPHAKIDRLDQLVGLFARLDGSVDFDALDDQRVDLVFLLLAPGDSGADHLKALARIAKIFRDPELCRRLRAEADVEEVRRLLTSARGTPPA